MDKRIIYDLKINEDDDSTGVYTVAQVDFPAIEQDFIALSKDKDKMEFTQTLGMKQYLTGPVLVPDMLITRLSESGSEYYVRFSAEEIEKIVKKFFRKGYIHNSNLQHKVELDSNYVFESWIVIDPDNDKSKAMGFKDIVKGTWMMTYHIPDTDYWNAEIMSGKRKGFSIEGFFDQIKVQMKKMIEDGEYKMANGDLLFIEEDKVVDKWTLIDIIEFNKLTNKMKDKTFLQKMKEFVFKTEKMMLSDHTLSDGTMIYVDDATKEAFKVSESGEKTVLPDGEYAIKDGGTINVLNGLVVDAPAEAPVAAAAEKVLVDERVISIDDTTKAVTYMKDGVATPLEDGEFELKDGSKIMVKDGLLVEAIVEADMKDETVKEEDLKEVNEQMSKLLDQMYALSEKQKSKIDVLEEKLTKQGKSIAKLEKSFEEFSKAPAGKAIDFSKTVDIEEKSQGRFIDFNRAYELKHK